MRRWKPQPKRTAVTRAKHQCTWFVLMASKPAERSTRARVPVRADSAECLAPHALLHAPLHTPVSPLAHSRACVRTVRSSMRACAHVRSCMRVYVCECVCAFVRSSVCACVRVRAGEFVGTYVCACIVCACVRASERACVRACVRAR
eukprot:2256369-Pleurochrysis_carterae.AAC.6